MTGTCQLCGGGPVWAVVAGLPVCRACADAYGVEWFARPAVREGRRSLQGTHGLLLPVVKPPGRA